MKQKINLDALIDILIQAGARKHNLEEVIMKLYGEIEVLDMAKDNHWSLIKLVEDKRIKLLSIELEYTEARTQYEQLLILCKRLGKKAK